ncbi:MAG: TatD family hydrolase [Clostridia bacterium]|nr:TatD family hydrolase [Clostridia bacterium]
MIKLIDSHAHYDDGKFDAAFEGGADAALEISFDAGVEAVINVATNPDNAKTTLALAERYPNVYAAIGIHPSDCREMDGTADEILTETEKLLSHPKVVAIGEVGLDYYWEPYDKSRQAEFFERQLDMAKAHDLPVIVHSRDAIGDALVIVRRHEGVRGVFHSFSGSAEVARELVSLGWYISLGGPITYKGANKVRNAAAAVPADRLLIETDCPYLPPVPHRGEINYSAYMFFTLSAMAQATGIAEDRLAAKLVENTKRLFGI